MKKILSIILCLFLLVPVCNVKAESSTDDFIVSSFEIIGINDGKANAGDTLEIRAELEGTPKLLAANLCFEGIEYFYEEYTIYLDKEESGIYVGEYTIPEDWKYKYESVNFKYVKFICEVTEYEEDVVRTVFSNLSEDELNFMGISEKPYPCKNYSFVIENKDIDTKGPELKDGGNIEVTFDDHILYVSADAIDDKIGVGKAEFKFVEESTGHELTVDQYSDTSKDGKVVSYMTDVYRTNPYGSYTLKLVKLYDKLGTSSEIDFSTVEEKVTFKLEKKNNVFEKLTIDDLIFNTSDGRVVDKLEIVKDSGMGNNFFNVFYTNDKNKNAVDSIKDICLAYHNLDVTAYDISKTGTFNYEYTLSYQKNYTETGEIEITISVDVVDIVGEVILLKDGLEYCVSYEEYAKLDSQTELWTLFKDVIFVKNYETGKLEKVEPYFGFIAMAGIGGSTASSTFITAWMGFTFSPKYEIQDRPRSTSMEFQAKIYLVNKNGDLVDEHGNTLVKYKDRAIKEMINLTTGVQISSLEGCLPSYTEVNAKTNENLGEVFDKDYFAYDITLESYYDKNIQPLGDVDVTFALDDEFKGKELEVYYVDDEGNKELIESSVENGEITFTTDHFSTYAVTVKEATTPSIPDDSETPETPATPETPKAPTTGDTTSVAGLLALLLASAYVLVKKVRA